MKNLSLLQCFSVVALLAALAFTALFGQLLSHLIERNALLTAREITASFAVNELLERFTLSDLSQVKTGQDYDTFSLRMKDAFLGHNVSHIKLWTADHAVAWSDNRDLVGKRFPGNRELAEALAGATVSDLLEEGKLSDKYRVPAAAQRFMELYVPVRPPGQSAVAVVLELYQGLDQLYAQIARQKLVVWAATGTGMGALYLALLGIVFGASRLLESRSREIERSEERYSSLIGAARDGIVAVNREGRVVLFNQAAETIFGFSSQEVLGQSPVFLLAGQYQAVYDEYAQEFVSSGRLPSVSGPIAVTGLRKTGEACPLELTISLSGQGEHALATAIIRDITEERKIESALKTASDDWRVTFDSTKEIILMVDRHQRIVKVNRAGALFLGLPFGQIVGRNFFELFRDIAMPLEVYPLVKIRQSRTHESAEVFLSSHGVWVLASADPILDETGNVSGAVHTLVDISSRIAMQEKLTQAKEEWEETFDIINDAITIHDREFRIVRANKAAHDLLGLPADGLGLKCYEFFHGSAAPHEACPSCRALESGRPSSFELYEPHLQRFLEVKVLPRFDGNRTVVGFVHVVRDVSERRCAEEEQRKLQLQIMQVQKMESVGRLAGGIAHDFNNILSAIIGYSELVMRKIPRTDPVWDKIRIIKEAGDKATALTRQLLAFSRKQVLEMKPTNLNDLVGSVSEMLGRIIGDDIVVELKTKSRIRSVMADPVQVEQVLMNLVVNARDAMPAGGSLVIETSDVLLDEKYSRVHEDVQQGAYVMVSVTDTGAGMPPDVQEKIFDPFFTTKELGKGTGLGLATVYGIVKQHRGHIFVYSEPAKGTTFKIYFPAEGDGRESPEPREAADMPGGSETLLVVDDNDDVRKLLIEILAPLGYRVLDASSAAEAISISNHYHGPIDLLLSDVIMPGENGKTLSERLLMVRPFIKVIFMSGYTDDTILRHGIAEPGTVFIQKPLSPTDLARRIRAVLGSP